MTILKDKIYRHGFKTLTTQCDNQYFKAWVSLFWSIIMNYFFGVLWCLLGFPGGSAGKESACNVGDLSSVPGLGRSSGEGNGNPLQDSCLQIPMDGSLVSYSPWVRRVGRDWATFTFTFFVSITGQANLNNDFLKFFPIWNQWEKYYRLHLLLKTRYWTFPGGQVVKTLPSNTRVVVSIPGQEAKSPLKTPQHKTHTRAHTHTHTHTHTLWILVMSYIVC